MFEILFCLQCLKWLRFRTNGTGTCLLTFLSFTKNARIYDMSFQKHVQNVIVQDVINFIILINCHFFNNL